MNTLYAKVRIGTANMLLADLEKHAAGVPIFDRVVDGKGSSLGNPAKWRENIEEVLNLPGIAQAAPAEYQALLLRWQVHTNAKPVAALAH